MARCRPTHTTTAVMIAFLCGTLICGDCLAAIAHKIHNFLSSLQVFCKLAPVQNEIYRTILGLPECRLLAV